jgi:hypothetical protein
MKTGQIIDYRNQPGVIPVMVGTPCSDGAGSFGMAVPSTGGPTQSNADGDWAGTLQYPGGSLPLVLHINPSGSTMESPSQGGSWPANVTVSGNNISFTVNTPQVKASYKGTIQGTEMKGTYSQNGSNLPLTFTKQ